jgi:hypothetical protein
MLFAVIVELPAAPKVDVKLGRCLHKRVSGTAVRIASWIAVVTAVV